MRAKQVSLFAGLDLLMTATGAATAEYPLLLTAFERQTGRFSYVRGGVLFVMDWAHDVLNDWPHLHAYELKTADTMRGGSEMPLSTFSKLVVDRLDGLPQMFGLIRCGTDIDKEVVFQPSF